MHFFLPTRFEPERSVRTMHTPLHISASLPLSRDGFWCAALVVACLALVEYTAKAMKNNNFCTVRKLYASVFVTMGQPTKSRRLPTFALIRVKARADATGLFSELTATRGGHCGVKTRGAHAPSQRNRHKWEEVTPCLTKTTTTPIGLPICASSR